MLCAEDELEIYGDVRYKKSFFQFVFSESRAGGEFPRFGESETVCEDVSRERGVGGRGERAVCPGK